MHSGSRIGRVLSHFVGCISSEVSAIKVGGPLVGIEDLDCEIDDFDSADDGEASEETHGSSDETDLALKLDLLVPLDLVKGGRVKVDLNHLWC